MQRISKYLGTAAIGLIVAAGVVVAAVAAERATKDEAMAMVEKAVAAIKTNGAEKTYAAIDAKDGGFVDRDLYIVVYGFNGMVYAHGANPKLIGTNQIDAKDPDGKAFVAERIALAKKGQPFWQDYKFMDPLTHTVVPKEMYCIPLNDTAVCGGVYKP